MPDIKDIEIEFRNEVLGWHLSHLDKRKQDHPEFLMQGLNALPSTFWGMSHYHSSFKDLILYEALSILRDGLEGIGYHRYPAERQRAIGDLTLSSLTLS